jgi:hypothetical protein
MQTEIRVRRVVTTLSTMLLTAMLTGFATAGAGATDVPDATQMIYDFKKLGNGGCRTADGGHGIFLPVKNVSLGRCKEHCIEGGPKCKGLEYNRSTMVCELHLDTPQWVAPGSNAECYRSLNSTECAKC